MKNSALKIIIVLLIFSLVFVSLGCTDSPEYSEGSGDSTSDPSSSSTNKDNEQPDLEILDHQLQTGEYGTTSVVGTAKANKDLSYAEVRVKFYDANGNLIGSSLDNINDIGAGESWSFDVPNIEFDKDVSDYKIAVGSTF
ncbi:FxLYD domain-containing protein [Methanohalophilus sp. DAL1]|jgi:hypothetical protein|uniref:FxLYD domain-containing protein n=1 Tax=Methanohalophilus sp. DAL1 TaxID=1864608 RepID=UPI000817D3CB|nr:FxLYD domain-containing protein [Methanohalophilus sp. DAL1]OBZ36076.1 MAG: hypothetical protein A9957_04220 [Methanohalophilus sp. DAL1]